MVRSDLSTLKRVLVCTLLITHSHFSDTLSNFIKTNLTSAQHFEYQKQLLYFLDKENNQIQIQQISTCFNYQYEYLGCTSRLVRTPLTEKCLITMTRALHLHYGGQPQGPAGTGKTETIKDLSKALGQYCLVFNCTSDLDIQTLNRFFSGLVLLGSWCCLDEFNLIDIGVLSVIG